MGGEAKPKDLYEPLGARFQLTVKVAHVAVERTSGGPVGSQFADLNLEITILDRATVAQR